MRSVSGPQRYGLSTLKGDDKEKTRVGALLAIRSCDTAQHAQKNFKPWTLEQPHWRPGTTSMFTLDEFQQLEGQEGVRRYTLAQCRFGAEVENLTDLLSNLDLSQVELLCSHQSRWWRIPWSGEWYFGPRMPLKGRQKAVLASEWIPDMLRGSEPQGSYITREYAAYPSGLNEALCKCTHKWQTVAGGATKASVTS